MKVTTQDQFADEKIAKTLGLVRGNTVRARHVGKDILAGLRNIVGGEIEEYTKLLGEAREQATDRMIAYAILKASDNGYSTRQVVEAIHDKSLTDSGNIEGETPSQTKQANLSSETKAENIKLAAGSLSGLLLAGDNSSTKLKNPTYDLLDEVTSISSQLWMIWLLRATGNGQRAKATALVKLRQC